jgi:hypothetical protein
MNSQESEKNAQARREAEQYLRENWDILYTRVIEPLAKEYNRIYVHVTKTETGFVLGHSRSYTGLSYGMKSRFNAKTRARTYILPRSITTDDEKCPI